MMKRIVFIALLLAALAGALVWALNFWNDARVSDLPPMDPPAAEQVARGAYLARAGNCIGCHTDRGGRAFAGGRGLATPFGTLYASNLTPDAQTGLGQWSREQFWRAMHFGRSRDGRLLYPAFPYTHYTQVTREDADAIFDFLRNLPPVRQANRAHELRWPYNTQAALAVWRTLYFRPGVPPDEPGRPPEWKRGAYLVQGLGHCGACHATRNALGATANLLDLSGGLIPMQNWYAPSLSAPSEAGVANWTVDEIVQLLKHGASPRGTVQGPMAEVVLQSTQYLDDQDLRAMAAYLKSLPPTPGAGDADPREMPRAGTGVLERGAKIYEKQCAQCHGADGKGVPGAYPALAGNRAVNLAVTANLVQVVLYGGYPPATRGNPRPYGMPPFTLQLSDGDVAAVLTYIRGSWGNRSAPVSELAVSQQRASAR